jgi:membrane glycosyltransferase
LLTSPFQSVLTSSTRLGLGSKARGLFLTEDDTRPAPELLELHQSRTAGAESAAITAAPSQWLPVTIDEASAPTLR